jgi:hypothetical protein
MELDTGLGICDRWICCKKQNRLKLEFSNVDSIGSRQVSLDLSQNRGWRGSGNKLMLRNLVSYASPTSLTTTLSAQQTFLGLLKLRRSCRKVYDPSGRDRSVMIQIVGRLFSLTPNNPYNCSIATVRGKKKVEERKTRENCSNYEKMKP